MPTCRIGLQKMEKHGMHLNEYEMSFTRVNLYEQIADYLEKRILLSQDAWKEGNKIPGEQELADSFGVSRNVIRETIKVLKERGLLESRNGVGAYITKPDQNLITAMIYRYVLMNEADPEEIYDVRLLLEVFSAQKAAQKIDEVALTRLQDYLKRMDDRSLSIQDRREMDFEFHVEIARLTGNRMLEILVSAMKEVLLAMMEKGIVSFGGIDDAGLRHEQILDALRRHDSSLAGEMMRNHIEASRELVRTYEKNRQNKKDTSV